MSNDGQNGRSLPDGWEWSTVGEAGKTITGNTPPKSDTKNYGDFIPFIKPPELNDGSLWKSEDNLSEEGAGLARVVPEKAVLVSCIGNLGKTGIAKRQIAFNQQINAVVFPENVLPEFGFYYFQSSEFRKQLEDIASATTISIVNKSKFNSLRFPLAPLPVQERIVSRIEELFSDLDAGVAALERVRTGLKRYKASVLKAACEGKLLENKNMENSEDLLDGWVQVEFKEIIASLKNGYFYGRPSTEPVGVPILRISAVRPMSVNYSDLRYIPEIKEKEIENYFLSNGDLLFTRYNGNLSLVGACGLVHENSPRVIYPDKLIRVRVQDNVLPEYLEIYFATITARKLIEGRVKSTAGQHGISGGDIKSIPVILPPLDEQRRIVAEVERRLSVVGEVESAVEVGLVRAGRLRQSVLRSAFEGRL